MLEVALVFSLFNNHVAEIHLDDLSYVFFKNGIHHHLVGRPCIFEPKRHDPVAIQSLICDEWSRDLIRLMHINMIVSQKCIKKI